jgi:hypothetical protein
MRKKRGVSGIHKARAVMNTLAMADVKLCIEVTHNG